MKNLPKQFKEPYNNGFGEMKIVDGIFRFHFDKDLVLDLETAIQCVNNRIEYCEHVSYPCLIDVSRIKEATKETRDYMADKGNDYITASALLVNSKLVSLIANFFISVNKPKNPTKVFTNEFLAIEWLYTYQNT